MPEAQDFHEMLIAPIQDEAHRRQVWESLEFARAIGDTPAIVILLAQLGHSKSWRPEASHPTKEAQPTTKEAQPTKGE